MSKHTYCLYNNENQDELLTMAYSEEELIEESKYYTGGTWFIYDNEGESVITNEREYTEEIEFPENPLERITSMSEVEEYKWVK